MYGRLSAAEIFLQVAVRKAAFGQVLLVIVLGRPELRSRDDFGDNRAFEGFLRRIARCTGVGFLLGRVEKDRGAVLVADVGTLARLPAIVGQVRRGARFTVFYRSRPAFHVVPVDATIEVLGDLASDSLYHAKPLGRSTDGRSASDHDSLLYRK